MSASHGLATRKYIQPKDLVAETLITYPVSVERLDIYTQFLMPSGVTPRRHKVIETTDIMMQMVASQRGVAALPRWLAEEYAQKMDVVAVRLGQKGIAKQIFLGARESDVQIDYLASFITLSKGKVLEHQADPA